MAVVLSPLGVLEAFAEYAIGNAPAIAAEVVKLIDGFKTENPQLSAAPPEDEESDINADIDKVRR